MVIDFFLLFSVSAAKKKREKSNNIVFLSNPFMFENRYFDDERDLAVGSFF